MNLILRQVIGYQQGRKAAPLTADPELKRQLENTKKDLKSILNKWKFGEEPLKTSQEFLNKFEPWINTQLESQKNLKLFLAKKGVNNLTEAETKLTNRELGDGEELTQLQKELAQTQQKHEQELAQQAQTFLNTEADYLEQIQTLKENRGELPEDYEALQTENKNLTTERDTAIRDKQTAEQEALAKNNQLKNKTKEAQNKDKEIQTLKKRKNPKRNCFK
jgi:chromosome segregation ATPase